MLVLFISNLDQISWVATAYLLTSAITTLMFGKLGDMYDRKKIFQFSVAVFLIGSVLCGTAQDMTSLIAFRALQGIGGGGLNSLIQAIIGDVIPARQRSRYQACLGIVATVALIAGPFLGGLFSADLSWRWIFYINIPVGAVALVVIALRLRLPRRTTDARADVTGGLLATVFITPLRLFRGSVFSISAVQFLLATMVLFVGLLYVPLFLQTVQGMSPFTAGLYVIPMLVGLIVATAVTGPVIARTGRYKIYPVIGAVLTGVSKWLLSLAGGATPAWAIIGPLIVAGAGLGLFVQVALLAGQNAADYADLGSATGTLNFFKSIGGALGAALFGTVLTAGSRGAAPSAAAFHHVFWLTAPG